MESDIPDGEKKHTFLMHYQIFKNIFEKLIKKK